MKKQIALFLVAFIATVNVCVTILATNNIKTIQNLSEEISGLKSKIEVLATKCNNLTVSVDNSVLLDKLEQLTRENVVLRQEVADLTHQLDLYDGEELE